MTDLYCVLTPALKTKKNNCREENLTYILIRLLKTRSENSNSIQSVKLLKGVICLHPEKRELIDPSRKQ